MSLPNAGAVLRGILMADADVHAMVAGRIYPQRMPQGDTYPAIAYLATASPESMQSGRANLTRIEIEVECCSRERDGVSPYAESAELARRVAKALDGYRGTVSGVRVHSASAESIYDDGVDEETGIYYTTVSGFFWASVAP